MNATEELKNDVHKDPRRLEREADAARADMERTLAALEERLSPGELLDRSLHLVKDNGGEFGRNLGVQVRNNPVPTLLTGIGMAWLMAASKRPPRPRADDGQSIVGRVSSVAASAESGASRVAHKTKSAAHDAAETTRQAVGGAARAATHTAAGVSDAARGTASAVRGGARQVHDGYVYMQREQPFLLGALAVAAGAAIGAMLPSTRAEDEWLGEQSEEATERLKAAGQRKLEQAEAAAADAAEAAGAAIEPDGQDREPGSGHAAASEQGNARAASEPSSRIPTPTPNS